MSWDGGYRAIVDGDVSRFARSLEAEPGLATESRDREHWPGGTLLEHAVWWQRDEIVAQLVHAGAPLDRPGGAPPETPLQRAVHMGACATGIVDRLGPAIDLETAAALGDVDGVFARRAGASERAVGAAFRAACVHDRRETALVLCPDAIALPGWPDREALVDALIIGRHLHGGEDVASPLEWARGRLELGDPMNLFDPRRPDGQGRSVLDAAHASGRADVITLVERRTPLGPRRVSPARVWRPANTPEQEAFLFACQWGQTSRVRAFLEADPSLVLTRTQWDMGALYLPGAYGSDGSTATALLLLEAGADPYDGIAGPCWWGATEMVLALLARGAPPERRERRDSGLFHACSASRYNEFGEPATWLPIVEALLDAGADPNRAGWHRGTPWSCAHEDVRPALEARGAQPDRVVPGLRALQRALREAPATAELLAADDPELLDFYDVRGTGCTPALAALLDGRRAFAERLLALKDRPDLNEAAAFGDVEVVRAHLDERGVLGPRTGATRVDVPLHFAAWCGQFEVVELLLERGFSLASANGRDVAGLYRGTPALRETTPLHAAAAAGHAATVERFLDALDEHWSG